MRKKWTKKTEKIKEKRKNRLARKNLKNTDEDWSHDVYKLTNRILPELFASRYEMNDVVPITTKPATITQYQTFLLNGCRKTLRTKPVGCRNTKHGLYIGIYTSKILNIIIAGKLESVSFWKTRLHLQHFKKNGMWNKLMKRLGIV